MVARPPLTVSLVSLAGFLALLCLVRSGWAPLDQFDHAVSEAMRAYGTANPDAVSVLRVATDVAATASYLLTGLVVSVVLVLRRQRCPALLCVAATVVVPMLWALMHWLLLSPRPPDAFVAIDSNGFPSGHTANATAAGLVAVLLVWPRLGRVGRALTVAAAAAVAGFVGLSRVALLAHWPADVLGGWLLGLAVVPLLARLATRGSASSGVTGQPAARRSAARRPVAPVNPGAGAVPEPGSRPVPDCADRVWRESG